MIKDEGTEQQALKRKMMDACKVKKVLCLWARRRKMRMVSRKGRYLRFEQ
jgi:hypothetical protein